jgi:hypothetical protein
VKKAARKAAKKAPKVAARKTPAKKAPKVAARKAPAKKKTAKPAPAKRRSPAKKSATSRGASIVDRVKRVATEVVEQAQTAVSQSVDAAKEFGETIVERVTS